MASTKYDLLIVDANSLIYRTHFASAHSQLSTDGQAMGATYGFFNILLKVMQSYPTPYLAFCWDVAKETFRNKLYKDYKSTRVSMPEELASQIPLVRNSLQLAGFSQLGKQGYEADDLIGSLSCLAKSKGMQVLVLSSDKDDLQLIDPNVSILMPKGAGVYELWDLERLQTEYGVNGDGWLQMKGLMGDTSDNIPGVKGIGIKSAMTLINKYQNVDNLLAHLSELTKTQQKKISLDRDNLLLSLELSRIKCDLPFESNLEKIKNPGYWQKDLANVLQSLKFKSLIERYQLQSLATTTYNFRALLTPNLLINSPTEFALWQWQENITANYFTQEPEIKIEKLGWQIGRENINNNLQLSSALLRDYIVLNYWQLLQYDEEARQLLHNWLQLLQAESPEISPFYSLNSELQQAFKNLANWKINYVTEFTELPQNTEYFYLPYLKITNDKHTIKANEMAFMLSNSVTDGLLWTLAEPSTLYVLAPEILRKLLCKVQTEPLTCLASQTQTYEKANFYSWQLKDLLKALDVYSLRPDFGLDCESITQTELLRNSCENKQVKMVKSGSAYLDIDLLAYTLGCLQTDLYLEFFNEHKKEATVTVKDIESLLENTLFYLDVAYAQVIWTKAATLLFRIEQPLVVVLAKMEKQGILLDQAALTQAKEFYHTEMTKAERQFMFAAGHPINLNSPEQISNFLFTELNLVSGEQKLNKSGFISTRNEYLQELAPTYPLVQTLLDYRKYQKLLAFAEGLQKACNPETNRVSTEFLQTKTATGRLSSQNPNLQNIPVRAEVKHGLREVFVAESGRVLLDVDYSQIELRIMAALANDPVMLQAFKDGRDIHSEVASHIFHKEISQITPIERSHAKAINFSLIYGATAFGTAKRLNISFKEAKTYLENYFHKFSKIKDYMDFLQSLAAKHDYVATVFARRRYLEKVRAHQLEKSKFEFTNKLQSLAKTCLANIHADAADMHNLPEQKLSLADKRIIINTPIQGTGADIIKLAMLKTVLALKDAGFEADLLLQVHDELLFSVKSEDVEQAASLVKKSMESLVDIGVKLEVKMEWGENWAEIH